MSARRIDCTPTKTGGHIGPPLRWKLPPRRAVHPKRSRSNFRNEKKLRFLLAYELRKQIEVTAFDEWNCRADVACVGADLRWKLPPRRAVHPKRSRSNFRNEKKLRFLLAYELRKLVSVTARSRARLAC